MGKKDERFLKAIEEEVRACQCRRVKPAMVGYRMGYEERQVRRVLSDMAQRGLVVRFGQRKGYGLPENMSVI